MSNDKSVSGAGKDYIAWHSLSREQVLNKLKSTEGGLGDEDALERQLTFGKNELRKAVSRSPVITFGKQFMSPLIIILLAATAVSAFLGETLDAIIILVIVALAAVVSFVQEYRSEKAIEALRQIISPLAVVVRNRRHVTIKSEDIVPGDVIVLSQGDRVPADAYILESHALQANEAALTGESMPVEKNSQPNIPETQVAERKNIVHSGTTVTLGRGKAIVFGIGHMTELGKIATSVQSVERQKTPFEIRMSHIGKMLTLVMLVVVVIITFLGVYRGNSFVEMLVWGISVAVAAIPEALPAVIATSLTIGVYKMAQKNAIVRRLPAVETLGGVTVICSDKTGTLTTGKMAVRKLYIGRATVSADDAKLLHSDYEQSDIELLARATALCNDAMTISSNDHGAGRAALDSAAYPSISGDPTEVALASFSSLVLGVTKEKLDIDFPRLHEIPFSSERKRMTTVHGSSDPDKMLVVSKGAPEIILKTCNRALVQGSIATLNNDDIDAILRANDALATKALRVLAISYKEIAGAVDSFGIELEKDHVFLGLVGLMDPPREEAMDAIKQCKTAGIHVTMVTGDNKATAVAIAKEMGIIDWEANCSEDKAVTGSEIDRMPDDDLDAAIMQTRIFARVLPEHKLRITRAFQRKGHVVALTGDGVNDAPALKAADIGVAMGLTGTQVAKESASMILADDNFATIVTAIKEGRRIMDNVKKYLVYLLSANIGEILLFSSALIIGLPTPLLAKHILYINLATDGSPAIALSTEPVEPDIMRRKQQDSKKGVFSGTLVWLVGVSLILGALSLALFWSTLASNGWTEQAEAKARTMTFALIIFFEIFFAYSSRSFRNSFLKVGLLSNKALFLSIVGESIVAVTILTVPVLQSIFSLVPLEASDWAQVLMLATTGFIFTEATKAVMSLKRRNDAEHPSAVTSAQ